ncbi:YGR093W [Zygosaccharomyces parabailii]|nr:YGR093W [Zygosaccharomyces parabailii]
MTKAKILVIHVLKDDMPTILDKVKKLNNKSGPFDTVIFLGESGSGLDTISHSTDVPAIVALSDEDHCTSDSQHLTFLSKTGVHQLENGMRIGYVSMQNEKDSASKLCEPVDVLITQEWSSALARKHPELAGSSLIDEAVVQCHPRYHFVYGDPNTFHEFEPFIWSEDQRMTRFINLARYGSKNKWAYAFNIDIHGHEELSSSLAENPYILKSDSRKHDREDQDDARSSIKKSMGKSKRIFPGACHFCFTNPNVEDHLIVSIANKSYVTVAKGPLTVPTDTMDFSGHCLLIPIEHIPKPNGCENLNEDNSLQQELLKYETSIARMFYTKFRMSSVVFEIHSESMVHFHKQLIPISHYLVGNFQNALDRQVHINNAKFTHNCKLKFRVFNSFEDEKYKNIVNDPKTNYMMFTVYETPDSYPQVFLSQFEANDRIDLQLGRRTLAYILHLPNRTNWRSPACIQAKKEEELEVDCFQKAYKGYDITNSE